MADLLGNAVDWLDAQRLAHLSKPATYRRGSASAAVNVTLGNTQYETIDDAGAAVQAKVTDVIVSADELMLDGLNITPRIGDIIELVLGGVTLTYEVLALPGGEHYRQSDPAGRTLRIHAKQIG